MKMKLVEPSVKLLEITKNPAKAIEKAARTCYNSPMSKDNESRNTFIQSLLIREHLTPFEFADMTVEIVCDRGISHELVRHRLSSFCQQSTRYVKSDKCLTYIIPSFLELKPTEEVSVVEILSNIPYSNKHETKDNSPESIFIKALAKISLAYDELLNQKKCSPQQARSVLPNALATTIIMKANFREWLHVLKLRTATGAHPDMIIIANMIKAIAVKHCPEVFEAVTF